MLVSYFNRIESNSLRSTPRPCLPFRNFRKFFRNFLNIHVQFYRIHLHHPWVDYVWGQSYQICIIVSLKFIPVLRIFKIKRLTPIYDSTQSNYLSSLFSFPTPVLCKHGEEILQNVPHRFQNENIWLKIIVIYDDISLSTTNIATSRIIIHGVCRFGKSQEFEN